MQIQSFNHSKMKIQELQPASTVRVMAVLLTAPMTAATAVTASTTLTTSLNSATLMTRTSMPSWTLLKERKLNSKEDQIQKLKFKQIQRQRMKQRERMKSS